MSGGYFPVGFGLWHLVPNEKGMIRFRIYAVDIEQAGKSIDDIKAFAARGNEVAVHPFDGECPHAELAAHFKRFDLRAINKNLANANVVEYNAP